MNNRIPPIHIAAAMATGGIGISQQLAADTKVEMEPTTFKLGEDPVANGAAVRQAYKAAELKAKYTPDQIRAELRRRGLDERGQPLPKKPFKRPRTTAVGSNYQEQQAAKARRERKKQRKHRRGH